MKVLVTGGTSFVGRYVVEALLKDGHEVIASGRSAKCPKPFQNRVKWRQMDLATLPINPFDYFDQPDSLIHFAWSGLPNYASDIHLEQVPWHVNFIEAIIEGGLSQVIGVGTGLEYGMSAGCLKEDMTPTPPFLPYGKGKNSVRKFISEICHENDVCFQWLRLFYIVGEGQHKDSLFSQLNNALEAGNDFFPMSEGNQIRDFLDVESAAEMIIRIAGQKDIVGAINCCSGVPKTVLEFVESIIERKNGHIKLMTGAYPYPEYEAMEYWGDTTKQLQALKGEKAIKPKAYEE